MTEQEKRDYQKFLEQKKQTRIESGFEVKESYFNEAIKNCKGMEMSKNQQSLFD